MAEREDIYHEIEDAQRRGEGNFLRGLTIAEILAIDVAVDADSPGFDIEDFEPMASEVRDNLLRAARATLGEPDSYGRTPPLPEFALDLLERLVARMGIAVYIGRNDDNPRRPGFGIAFESGSVVDPKVLQDEGVSSWRTGYHGESETGNHRPNECRLRSAR